MEQIPSGIEGWIARDKEDKELNAKGQVHFFWDKPERYGMYWGAPGQRRFWLSDYDFPELKNLKWSNKPKKVKLTIQIQDV